MYINIYSTQIVSNYAFQSFLDWALQKKKKQY